MIGISPLLAALLLSITLIIIMKFHGSTPPAYTVPSVLPGSKMCDTTIKYNLHDSLPSEWTDEFKLIMINLKRHFPSDNYHSRVCDYTLYAWNSDANQPYGDISGASVSGDKIILEIPSAELTNQLWHRYSVIAHEYYHVYQLARSGGARCKWIMEGPAACFESLYINEYYNVNYFDQQKQLTDDVLTSPAEYESYEKMEVNYSNSVFMTLVLHKELVAKGDSVTTAFSKIFKEYWATNLQDDWKTPFHNVFGFTVDEFYSMLSNYQLDIDSVLLDSYPSISDYAHK